ncbi:MAG: sigma-54 dependent transcriptional regulator [Planctomycetota bacterium]
MNKPTLLIIEDQKEALEALKRHLRQYHILTATDGEEGLRLFEQHQPDLILTDVVMPKVDGLQVFQKVRQQSPETPIIVMSAFNHIQESIQALKLGAVNFIEKPILDIAPLKKMIQVELEAVQKGQPTLPQKLPSGAKEFQGMIGNHPKMLELYQLILYLAPTEARVLIRGEEGTGKELIASALQKLSRRADKPFVDLNLSAINVGTFESELFGHKRGSYTGAISDKLGAFLAANGGTLFLDEIGEVNQEIQIKLLRVLTKKEVKPVGSEESFPFDVRLISATNADLKKKLETGEIRRDFYDRIAGLEIYVPPLREHKEDIPLLVNHFIKKLRERNPELPVQRFSSHALAVLQDYSWPGNIRELENVISFAFFTTLQEEVPSTQLRNLPQSRTVFSELSQSLSTPLPLNEETDLLIRVGMPLAEVEKQFILKTLAYLKGNKTKTAQTLGIGERTIHRKLKEYGIS